MAVTDILTMDRKTTEVYKIENLRGAIARVFRAWEELPSAISNFRVDGVMDMAQDRYTLTHVDIIDERYHSRLLAHLEIRDSKIWILTDNTEEGIGAELVAEGLLKNQIVLGFYSPTMREMGEFAVT